MAALTPTEAAIRDHLTAGPRLLSALVEAVAPQVRVGRDEVAATVWDMVQKDLVGYGADAMVRLLVSGPQNPRSPQPPTTVRSTK